MVKRRKMCEDLSDKVEKKEQLSNRKYLVYRETKTQIEGRPGKPFKNIKCYSVKLKQIRKKNSRPLPIKTA